MSQPPPRLRLSALEDRVTPSWSSLPPSAVAPPTGPVAVTLNTLGDATGLAAITANEVDWYRVTVAAGTATFSATTPTSNLDTVIGVYSAAGVFIRASTGSPGST